MLGHWIPQRTLAFLIGRKQNAGGEAQGTYHTDETRLAIAALYSVGEEEGRPVPPEDVREHFRDVRRRGAARTWTYERKLGHTWTFRDNEFIFAWLEAVMALRLPPDADPKAGPIALRPIDASKGWIGALGDLSRCQPKDTYQI